jgi:hypothetical protein
MVDDGGVPPLPRRVPGASGSPRPTVRVDLGTISEDMRQRVLTAIAHEVELDEAERRRGGVSPPIGTGASPTNGASASLAGGSGLVSESSDASLAASNGLSPANGTSATTENGSGAGLDIGSGADPGERAGGGLDYGSDYGISADPVYVSPWERNAPWPGTPAQPWDIAQGEAADQGHGAEEDAAAAQQPGAAADHEEAIDAADAADGQDEADLGPEVPLPRRAPGTHGAPPPPAELRREYLPPSLLGRRLDSEAHTEPLPKISAAWREPGPGGPADTGSDQSAPSVFTPIRRAAAPPAPPAPAGSPAEPGPSAPVPSTAGSAGTSAEPEASSAEAVPPGPVPLDPVPPRSVASAEAIAAASAPTMPVGSAALRAASASAMPAGSAAMAAASAPTMPAGSAAMAAAAGFAPPAETDQTGSDLPPPADLATAPASSADVAAPADQAASPLVTSHAPPPPLPAPATSAQSRPPAASLPAPSGYGRTADPGPHPRNSRGAGPPLPAAPPAGKRPERSGRPYRIAGVILAIVALVVAGVIALVLSGGKSSGHHSGLGPPSRGAGALVRKRVAAWVAGQVSRTAVVACDPVMCQALMARGVADSRLYRLGPQTTSPLRSQIIVATAAVRAQFGNVLGSVYAPAVLASFGVGADRIDIRATAQHGVAAYRAMLVSDLASRKASGTELLHSGRIAAAVLARHELAEGEVDGRLLITIAQMAAAHPTFIVDFGSPAPGADPDMPLRQVDLAEDAHPHHHFGHAISAGYVRAMLAFLRAQHGLFRPARVQLMHLPDGAAVLRIEFTAPSPLGLLGPHA